MGLSDRPKLRNGLPLCKHVFKQDRLPASLLSARRCSHGTFPVGSHRPEGVQFERSDRDVRPALGKAGEFCSEPHEAGGSGLGIRWSACWLSDGVAIMFAVMPVLMLSIK